MELIVLDNDDLTYIIDNVKKIDTITFLIIGSKFRRDFRLLQKLNKHDMDVNFTISSSILYDTFESIPLELMVNNQYWLYYLNFAITMKYNNIIKYYLEYFEINMLRSVPKDILNIILDYIIIK